MDLSTPPQANQQNTQQTESGLTIYYDPIDQNPILTKKIVVLGFGSQGYGQATSLKASGANQLKIALRPDSATAAKVQNAGIETIAFEDVADWAEVIVFLLPDTRHKQIYEQYLHGKLKAGQTLVFAHGFSIYYNQIQSPADVDVVLVAPKGPGHLVREEYNRDRGVPALIAIHQDASGTARQTALAYASAIGAGRAGIIETNFKDETETDLFGEQAVLCGGASALVQAGFETLTEAGYPPELAYFECLHELKLIVDLMYEGGIEDMRYSISDTARYGDVSRGPRVITDAVKQSMKGVLDDIQSGRFADEWISENEAGQPRLKQLVEQGADHSIEHTGRRLRKMMPWLEQSRIIQRDKN